MPAVVHLGERTGPVQRSAGAVHKHSMPHIHPGGHCRRVAAVRTLATSVVVVVQARAVEAFARTELDAMLGALMAEVAASSRTAVPVGRLARSEQQSIRLARLDACCTPGRGSRSRRRTLQLALVEPAS